MSQTQTMILLSFVMLSMLVFSYTTGSGPEITNEREVVREVLSSQALRLPVTKTANAFVLGYLSRNVNFLDPELSAPSAFVWDGNINKIFFKKSSLEKRPVASITKLLTSAVILDNTNLDENVVVSSIAVEQEGTAGGLVPGETLSVKDLLHIMLMESSNDAAVALAEYVGGKESALTGIAAIDNFVSQMNIKAREIGLEDSYFTDPTGLNDTDSYSTAQDIAGLVFYLRENPNYTYLWDILGKTDIKVISKEGKEHAIVSNNPFLKEMSSAIGGKTGYTNLARESMTLLVKSPDRSGEIIYVVLGSEDRFGDIRTLVNWVSSAYVWQN